MANPEHLAKLQEAVAAQDISIWNIWRQEYLETGPFIHPDSYIDLSDIDLWGVDFLRGDFRGVRFEKSRLQNATLSMVSLRYSELANADLSFAKLEGTDLSGADLRWANFSGASLLGSNFSDADLYFTNFSSSKLNNAVFTNAECESTVFSNVDLSAVNGLEVVYHKGPSTIGIDTLYRSKGNIPEVFLRGCGVPGDMMAYARSLRGKAIDYYSCFISHSARDKRFCERLYADLQMKGVRVWFFEEDAKWGETVWSEIDRSIKIYDKLIVVCSENSLQSVPVQREMERALNREDKEHKNILFPIRIDGYIFAKDEQGNDKWQHRRKADVQEKVVGDFSGWERDAAKYERAFERLLKGLQAESTKA